jgi:hypothetical protein
MAESSKSYIITQYGISCFEMTGGGYTPAGPAAL